MGSTGLRSNAGIVQRRVFPSWSIELPASFEETFVDEDTELGYWHGFDDDRSVSLTSIVIRDENDEPVEDADILRQLSRELLNGERVSDMPPGLFGMAVVDQAPKPSRASRMLQGILVRHGKVLLATITSDDLDWARRTWLSIRWRPAASALARCGLNREQRRANARRAARVR